MKHILLLSTALIIGLAPVAKADFEYINAPQNPAMGMIDLMPAQKIEPITSAPLSLSNTAPISSQRPDIETASRDNAFNGLVIDPYPIKTKKKMVPVIEGFGNNLPLSIALKQIVPNGTDIIFDDMVDVNSTMLSWQGGKAWDMVLKEALAQKSLIAIIRNDRVIISKS